MVIITGSPAGGAGRPPALDPTPPMTCMVAALLCPFSHLEQMSPPCFLCAPTGQGTGCLRPPEMGATCTHIHIPDLWAPQSEPLLVLCIGTEALQDYPLSSTAVSWITPSGFGHW